MLGRTTLGILLFSLLWIGCDEPTTCVSCAEDDASQPDAAAIDAGGGGDDASVAGCTAACAELVVVDPEWLEAHLDDPALQIVDTRSAAEHASARIPGALFLDPDALRATVGGVSGQVAPTADLQAAFRAAGLARDRIAVVYGESTTTTPARVFWTLEHAAHPGVLFLDGGITGWTNEGRPTDSSAFSPTASDYTIDALDDTRRVEADWVRDHLSDTTVHLVDARSSGEFDAGRIAGATSVDWMLNVTTGSLKTRIEVEALYAAWPTDSTTMVAYCQTGSRASVTYLVMRWLGYTDVRLYDGSWSEWSTLDPSTYTREP